MLTWSEWIRAFRRFPLSVLVTIYFIAASTIEGIMAIFALYLERAILIGAVEVGLLWTWAGVVQIAVRGLLVGRVATRFGEHRAVVVGVSTLVCAMVLLPVMPSFSYTFVAATLYAAGQTLWRVPMTHFSPWDCNWPYGPPPPNPPGPAPGLPPPPLAPPV